MNNAGNNLDVRQARSINAELPLVPFTRPNSTRVHIIKIPTVDRDTSDYNLQRLRAEWAIQPGFFNKNQMIWWTSYIVVATPGILTRDTGVYPEWNEFGVTTEHGQPTGMILPRTSGIIIVDMWKGVVQPSTAHAFTREVNLEGASKKADFYVCLVAAGMHDSDGYRIHGQARLEYSLC